MAVTAWLFPATLEESSEVTHASWSNLANLSAEDDVYATVALNPTQFAKWIRGSNYGIGSHVPAGATINGIEFRFSGKTSASTIDVADVWLIDPDTGLQAGDDKGAGTLTTTEAFLTFGGAADTWNSGLTRDKLASVSFKVHVHLAVSGAMLTVSLDSFQIRIHYTTGAVPLGRTRQRRVWETTMLFSGFVAPLPRLWLPQVYAEDQNSVAI